MRLIDADALIEKAQWMEMPDNQGINFDVRAVSVSGIDLAPTVEAEPVRHGRWVMKNTCGPHTGKLHCSVCGESPRSLCAERYCPNCGAKMDLPN